MLQIELSEVQAVINAKRLQLEGLEAEIKVWEKRRSRMVHKGKAPSEDTLEGQAFLTVRDLVERGVAPFIGVVTDELTPAEYVDVAAALRKLEADGLLQMIRGYWPGAGRKIYLPVTVDAEAFMATKPVIRQPFPIQAVGVDAAEFGEDHAE